MGDACEFITPSDPRWDSGSICDWVSPDNIGVDQANWYIAKYEPIKSQILGKLAGNHEDSIKKYSHIDVHSNICKGLGIADLGYSCFLKFEFARGKEETHIYTAVFTHGSGSPIMPGTKMQRLSRLMDQFEADIVAQGHLHDVITYTKPYLALDNTNHIRQRVRVGAVTGCYFRTYTENACPSYGEKKNYPAVSIGSPCFVIHPDKGILRVENG